MSLRAAPTTSDCRYGERICIRVDFGFGLGVSGLLPDVFVMGVGAELTLWRAMTVPPTSETR
ncbi:hypothetical protein D7S86_05180 [Pararobbsia silviterrae]|uniref:Uncharacterized protein n=1 Tax=Pararobbsia silviterrae TaxID=1792498 RepID=A0A494YEY5_9BURK|nr:hypothetical protein D7S86_05180 [Pararobbsia silviterrae]